MGKKKNIDKMSNKERIKSLMLNAPIDRVPFIPYFLSYFAVINGISIYDFFTKPDLAFKAGLTTMKKYPWASIRPAYDWADHGAWEFGGKIEWPIHKGNLQHWRKVPFPGRTIFTIGDDMDLKETGDFLGEKYILAGNISTTTIQTGTKEDVIEEVKRCLSQAKDRSGGFILMPACEWPPLAPSENLEAVREALMEYGFY